MFSAATKLLNQQGGEDVTVSFYENRFGTTIGTINVYLANTSGALITPSLYTASGNNGDVWVERTCTTATVNEDYRIVWHYVSGTSFTGDYAIEDISINGVLVDEVTADLPLYLTIAADPDGQNTSNSITAFNDSSIITNTTSSVEGRWNINTGGTPSSGTGPSAGLGGSGYYMYTETSSPNNPNINMWLFSTVKKVGQFNPEAGLTLTRTEEPGAVAAFSATERAQNAVFACEVNFGTSIPSSLTGAVLFDMGAGAIGHAVALSLSTYGTGDLIITAGDGATPPDSTINAFLDISSSSIPYDGGTHTIVWDIQINPGRVRCWIDGEFFGSANTSGGGALESSTWAGGASGGYGTCDNVTPPCTIASGNSASDWTTSGGRSLNSTLRYYQNQLVSYP